MGDVDTIKMKFTGRFVGLEKVVELPVPLAAMSQRLDDRLIFKRTTPHGPGFCDVPIKWVGKLLAIGGHWQLAGLRPSKDVLQQIEEAKQACDAELQKQALDNELVDA